MTDAEYILRVNHQEREKPRPWLSDETSWLEARREVEERRQRKRAEEQKVVEDKVRKREREESMAGKEEWSRQLDRKAAEDWAYQVILKERLRKQEEDDERRRIIDERGEVMRNEQARKEAARAAAEEEMRERAQVGNLARRRREQEKIEREAEQREQRVKQDRESAKEKEEKENLKRSQYEERQGMGALLRSQMKRQEDRRREKEEERQLEELRERRRLGELVLADKVERERREKEKQEEKHKFLNTRMGLHEARLKRAREEAMAFFEEGRKLESVVVENEEKREKQKAAAFKDIEKVLLEQMGEKLKVKTSQDSLAVLEQEERLVAEARVKEMEMEEVREDQRQRARYGEAVLSQREADVKRREEERRRKAEEDKMMERHFRKLDAIDAREVAVPLPVLYN